MSTAAAMQGDRTKTPKQVPYRTMTRAEVLALKYGEHPNILLNNGKIGVVKINGAIRTWKRDPNRVEVPVKYGMYECATLSLDEAMRRFVVLLGEQS